MRLWCHEGARVFRDRLVCDTDRAWYDSASLQHMQAALGGVCPWEHGDSSSSLFGTYLSENGEYREMTDIAAVQSVLSHRLEEHNESSECKMSLLFFQYAVSHLARISRIIRLPRGERISYVFCVVEDKTSRI